MNKIIAIIGGLVAGGLCYKGMQFFSAIREDMNNMVTEEDLGSWYLKVSRDRRSETYRVQFEKRAIAGP